MDSLRCPAESLSISDLVFAVSRTASQAKSAFLSLSSCATSENACRNSAIEAWSTLCAMAVCRWHAAISEQNVRRSAENPNHDKALRHRRGAGRLCSVAAVAGLDQVVRALLSFDQAGVDRGREGRIIQCHRQVGAVGLADFFQAAPISSPLPPTMRKSGAFSLVLSLAAMRTLTLSVRVRTVPVKPLPGSAPIDEAGPVRICPHAFRMMRTDSRRWTKLRRI